MSFTSGPDLIANGVPALHRSSETADSDHDRKPSAIEAEALDPSTTHYGASERVDAIETVTKGSRHKRDCAAGQDRPSWSRSAHVVRAN